MSFVRRSLSLRPTTVVDTKLALNIIAYNNLLELIEGNPLALSPVIEAGKVANTYQGLLRDMTRITGTFNYGLCTETLNPTDDSYTAQNAPNTPHDDDLLKTGISPGNARYGFIEFDLTHIPVGVISAVLRLYATAEGDAGQNGTFSFYVRHEDFNETTLTYNNMPSNATPYAVAKTQAGFPAGTQLELNVKHLIIHPIMEVTTKVTFRIQLSTALYGYIYFEDRENTGETGNIPELVITYLYALS